MGPDDYKGWELISGRDITPDGHWIWYQVTEVEADGYLMLKNCDDPRKQQIANGSTAAFSDDSNWFAYLVGPGREEADKLRESKKPVETKMVLKNLATGTEQTFEQVSRFRFLKGSRTLLADRYPADPSPGAPSDLLVVSLPSLKVLPVASVVGVAGSHDGGELGVITKTTGGEQGLEIIDCGNLLVTPIAWGKDNLRDPAWSKDGKALCWLSGKTSPDHEADFNALNEVTGFPAAPNIKTLDAEGAHWLPQGRRISEFGGLDVSDDGAIVGFGVGDWPIKHKPDDKAHPEVWNSKDLRVVPEQKVSAPQDRERTDLFVWRPASGPIQRITDGWEESGDLLDGLAYAVVIDQKPYLKPNNDGFDYNDILLIDTASGQKSIIAKKIHGPVSVSRKGRFVAYYADKSWWMFDVKSKLAKLAVPSENFENVDDDHTRPEKPPAGMPEWLADDRGVILSDDFDCYLWRPDGVLTKLTDGKGDHTIYRFVDPVGDEDGPQIGQQFYFSMFGKESKQSGVFSADSTGKGKVLVYADPRVTALKKAKNVDRMLFIMGSFSDSPNLYVTNAAFSAVKPESHTNSQQAKFLWPKEELISYKSRWGRPLQGFLIYPADYHPNRSYPMVTYIYERLSDNVNNYLGPNPANAYNAQVLSQSGYFVLEPDIAYKGNTPGQNAVDCLEPAVQAVLDKHVGVNPDRVGLIGHSWGAYQTAFVTTVSSMFRVGCAGAPLTDLISMYNTPYWNVGIFNAPLLETGQGRLRVPFWEDPKTYIDNSPVWQSMKRKAPLLVTVGDQDGAVDYHQGIELYNTLRRMGKDCILLVYHGENHNFTKHPDQIDYSKRLRHFLDVYLKDAKPEPWISQGIPFIEEDQD